MTSPKLPDEFFSQVNEEMKTYDDHANKTITHYWKEQGQVAGTFNAPTPSFGHDTNSTFFVSKYFLTTKLSDN